MAKLHQASLLNTVFLTTFALFVSASHFGNSCSISNFVIIKFVMVICNYIWSCYCNCFGTPQTMPIKMTNLINSCHMHSDSSTHQPFTRVSTSLWASLISWDTKIVKLGQLGNLQWPIRVQVKGRVKWWDKFHCYLILINCHSHPNLQQSPLWSVSSHQHWDKTLPPAKRLQLAEGSHDVSMFLPQSIF